MTVICNKMFTCANTYLTRALKFKVVQLNQIILDTPTNTAALRTVAYQRKLFVVHSILALCTNFF